jgi:hypothetical protein
MIYLVMSENVPAEGLSRIAQEFERLALHVMNLTAENKMLRTKLLAKEKK